MDERWESEVVEYGAINITGFRIVDASKPHVKEFLEGKFKIVILWKNNYFLNFIDLLIHISAETCSILLSKSQEPYQKLTYHMV